MGSYTRLSMIQQMYTNTCQSMYTEGLTVSTRNGRYKCESAQHGLIYKGICNEFMYICDTCKYAKRF